jgi:hypothetical protein
MNYNSTYLVSNIHNKELIKLRRMASFKNQSMPSHTAPEPTTQTPQNTAQS